MRRGVAGRRRHRHAARTSPGCSRSLAREFRYVVVDTAPGLSEQTLAALDRATDVVMLTSMDVPGVRGLRKELDVLRELCMIPAGRHVVMNFADPKGGLSVRDVETTIGTGVDVVLPRSTAVPASTNQGVPLLQSGSRRDPMVKELRRLVSRFAATPLMKPGRYRARHRAAGSMNLADRLAAAHGRPTPSSAPAAGRRRPAVPAPRPVAAPATAAARPTPSPRLKDRVGKALFERMGSRMNDPSLSAEQLRTIVLGELDEVVEEENVPLSTEERQRLTAELADDVLGYGPLQRLLDDADGHRDHGQRPGQRSTSSSSGKLTRTGACFTSEEHLRRVIDRIVSRVGRRIDESSPLVDARLADGSRVNAIIPPLAFSGSTLTIRKFSKDPFTVDDLIGFGTLSPEMAELLRRLRRGAAQHHRLRRYRHRQDDAAQRAVLVHPRGRADRHHRGRRRAAAAAGPRRPAGVAGRRTSRARARSPSATWSATRCACGPTGSWSGSAAAARRWTCSRR